MLTEKFGTCGKRCNCFLKKICTKGLQNLAFVEKNKRLFFERVFCGSPLCMRLAWFSVLPVAKDLKQSFFLTYAH